MNMRKWHHIIPFFVVTALMVVSACSTQKNTAKSRWWHAFNARYNTYFNGAQAYIDGSLAKEQGNKDNFTEIIPLYTVGNKGSVKLGEGQFNTAIEKAQKAIKRHSIKKRPEWTKSRKKTERDIEWLSRKEYNPFLWKAWMLMGRSQFHKGAFDEAAATFSYMSRLYQTQPAIYAKARAWLAKCYIEQDWIYDAEDVIRNMQRDSIDWRAVKEWDYTYADYYIHTGDYEKAIPYLRKVIKHEMRRKQKARECYLLGQLESALGHRDEAYKAFRRVIRLNPPYEVEFNARIAMSEVMAAGGKTKQTISQLKRMAASDKNKDYLDQVYYAIGNIYLSDRDTTNAISAYENGVEKATRSGIEKGVLLLKLGDLYWDKEKYGDARRCYGQAIGLLDRDRKDYKQLSNRSVILDELVPYTDAIHLQDSLQILANMSETDRNAAIDRVIEALKKKEKEERRKQQESEAAQVQSQNAGAAQGQQPRQQVQNSGDQGGLWYFYNQMAVNQGKTTFERQWGKRENADDWQRSNKTVVGNIGGDDIEMTDEMRDSIAKAEALQDSLNNVADSAQNDPHKREYYLAQIPFTEEQVAASNNIIKDGLHHSGVIFKDRLDNLRLSERQLRRLTDFYPDYEKMDDVYYHLFLLYSRKGETAVAEQYVQLLREKFPDSQWTTLLTDPHFRENSQFGVHMEDSLYAATYEAFKADRYSEVAGNARISQSRYPLGANRDKFIFINGLSKLNQGDVNGCVEDMNTVVKNYPKSRISEMAGMIVKGVGEGRKLHGGKFDLGDVWSRRAAVLNDSDSIQSRKFVTDRIADFAFILAYHPDSLNENQLLFEMARFNFTNFIVRNFELNIVDDDGLHLMTITGFRNFDEAHQYAEQLYANDAVAERAQKARAIIISMQNLELLGKQFSYDDYDEFYAKYFVPLKVTRRQLLTEPDGVGEQPEPDLRYPIGGIVPKEPEPTNRPEGDDIDDDGGNGGYDNFDGFDIDEPTNNDNNGFDIDEPAETVEPTTPIDAIETPDEPEEPEQTEKPQEPRKPQEPQEPEQKMQKPQEPEQQTQKPQEPEQQTQKPQEPEQQTQKPQEPEQQTQKSQEPEQQTQKPQEPQQPVQPQQPEPPVEDPNGIEIDIDDDDDDDTEIYFDDFGDTPTDQPTQKPSQNNDDVNIEDEYYELDGF